MSGDLTLDSLSGDPITLTNFDEISTSLTDGAHTSTRTVLTWDVEDDGLATFAVVGQLDHVAPASGAIENLREGLGERLRVRDNAALTALIARLDTL